MSKFEDTVTITFGDQAENHAGMQCIGELADEGFSVSELDSIYDKFEKQGIDAEIVYLNDLDNDKQEEAAILIIHNGVKNVFGIDPDDLKYEQSKLEPDEKAFMYGRVVKKKARFNLCFDDEGQEPDYENKEGRIVSWNDVPLLNDIRKRMGEVFGEKANNLKGEGNYYFDVKNCGIGAHGDSERRKVIAIRLGATMKLRYRWYYQGEKKGKYYTFDLNHGDIYVMSEKSTGFDWKKKKIWTLRHAAGCKKYIDQLK